jgi:site-specific recombinase XerD
LEHQTKAVHVWDTKNGQSRVIPLTRRADDALEGWLESKPLTKDQIESRWRTMRRHLGYTSDRQFVIHTLRHTCCTRLIRAGMEIRRVMMWMGHKDINTTLRYTHLCPSDLLPLAAALEQPLEVPVALEQNVVTVS